MLVWKGGESPIYQLFHIRSSLYIVTPTKSTDIVKTLTNGGKPPCKQHPRSFGGFNLKGHTMRKYINMDFDEKGKPVLGRAKDTATGGFVPTAWVPGASDGGNGIKSISISPAISTTPALDSLFPIYYENLTDEEKTDGVNLTIEIETSGGDYTFTFAPTSDWYAGYMGEGAPEFGGKGEAVALTRTVEIGESYDFTFLFANGTTEDTATEFIMFRVTANAVAPK